VWVGHSCPTPLTLPWSGAALQRCPNFRLDLPFALRQNPVLPLLPRRPLDCIDSCLFASSRANSEGEVRLNRASEFKNFFAAAFLAASLLFSLRPLTAQQSTGCGSGNQGGPRANSAAGATSGSAAQDQSPPPKGPGSASQGGPRAAPIHSLPKMGSASGASQAAAPCHAAGWVLREIWSEPFPEEFAPSHIDDEYIGIDDRGRILTKRQFVESRQAQHGFYLQDVRLHCYENVSVLIGILKGPAESYRYTAVLVEDLGRWKLVASQLTRIPE